MPSIRNSLYLWKRHFGVPLDFYREEEGEPDTLTGKKIITRTKYSIALGIFLDQTLTRKSPLDRMLGQLTGMMDVSRTSILFDGNDFVDKYTPVLTDYVIVLHKNKSSERFEINNIQIVDDNQSYWLGLTEFKGSQKFEIFHV